MLFAWVLGLLGLSLGLFAWDHCIIFLILFVLVKCENMAIFAIETEESENLINYISETNKRLAGSDMVYNPFDGHIYNIEKNLFLIKMDPVYPRFYYVGFMFLIIMIFFWGINWWLILPIFILSTGILWSRYFYYLLFKIGCKKHGHKNKIKFFGYNNTLELLVLTLYKGI